MTQKEVLKTHILIAQILNIPPDDIVIFLGDVFVFFDIPYKDVCFGMGFLLEERMPFLSDLVEQIEECKSGYESLMEDDG